MAFRAFTLGLVVFWSFPPYANSKVCFVDHTTVINLSFSYEKTASYLPGVKRDREIMAQVFRKVRRKTNLSDNDILTKDDILKHFFRHIKEVKAKGVQRPDILFNYSGHGLLTADGNFVAVLPGLPKVCIKHQMVAFKGDPAAKIYRGHLAASYVEKNRGLGRLDMSGCGNTRGLRPPDCKSAVEFEKEVAVVDDKSENCQRFLFGPEDFKQISAEANLYGLIDSCHSGAITRVPGVNMVASTQDNEEAADHGGGRLFNLVGDMLNTYSCSLVDDLAENQVKLSDVFKKLPAVTLSPTGAPEIVQFRGLGRQVLEDIYFQKQVPKVSETLKKNPSELDCFTVAFGRKSLACYNPLNYIHTANQQLNCGKGKVVARGERVVVTNELVGQEGVTAFTPTCGIFKIMGSDVHSLRRIFRSERLQDETEAKSRQNTQSVK